MDDEGKMPESVSPEQAYIVGCMLEHEDDHHAGTEDCDETCGLKFLGPRVEDERNAMECSANRKEIDCLLKSYTTRGEIMCSAEIKARIERVTEYANSFDCNFETLEIVERPKGNM
jgi:hypothetical protein